MNKKIIASLIALTSVLGTGCSMLNDAGHQTNAYTGEYERNDASQGLVVGAAIVGGAAAIMTAGSSTIAYSALVGTGFFGWVGLVNDQDSRATQKFLRENGVLVENGYKTITINLEEDVTFDLQKTYLKKEFEPTLDAIAMVLNELDGHATFEVVGHADYTGNDELNNYLSNERASVVTEYLVRHGVNPSNFKNFYGLSSSKPKDYCLDLSCLRRVEIIIHKNDILYNM